MQDAMCEMPGQGNELRGPHGIGQEYEIRNAINEPTYQGPMATLEVRIMR